MDRNWFPILVELFPQIYHMINKFRFFFLVLKYLVILPWYFLVLPKESPIIVRPCSALQGYLLHYVPFVMTPTFPVAHCGWRALGEARPLPL